jgi:phosphatidate cytidylyltransferase
MKERLITTLIALVVFVLGFRFVPGFWGFLLPVALGFCVYEAAQIFWLGSIAGKDSKPLCVFGLGTMTAGILAGYLAWVCLQSTIASLSVVSIAMWLFLFSRGKPADSFSRTFTLFGVLVVYVLVPFVLLWEIQGSFGLEVVFFILAPVWAADTGAYLIGKAIGRRPLAPKVSPGKTWEGLLGGLVVGTLSAFVYWYLLKVDLATSLGSFTIWHVLFWGAGISLVGQLGDLVQSNLKRASGIKDSGTVLPGHGGVLDRIDSALFAVPVVALALSFFG